VSPMMLGAKLFAGQNGVKRVVQSNVELCRFAGCE
jgi:hypothetical protein